MVIHRCLTHFPVVLLAQWWIILMTIFIPHDVVVGGLSFYSESIFYLLFSPATLQAYRMELNRNRTHFRKWVRFENARPKLGVSFSPGRGGANHLFWRFSATSQLNCRLTANIFWTKHDVDNLGPGLATSKGLISHTVPKFHELRSTYGLK